MATKKSKVTKGEVPAKVKKSAKRVKHNYQDHEFIIITGGGFLVAVLALVLFFN